MLTTTLPILWADNCEAGKAVNQLTGRVRREAGDLGPVYGFQWRHFGARYSDMHADYSGQGVDQLAEVLFLTAHCCSSWLPRSLTVCAPRLASKAQHACSWLHPVSWSAEHCLCPEIWYQPSCLLLKHCC